MEILTHYIVMYTPLTFFKHMIEIGFQWEILTFQIKSLKHVYGSCTQESQLKDFLSFPSFFLFPFLCVPNLMSSSERVRDCSACFILYNLQLFFLIYTCTIDFCVKFCICKFGIFLCLKCPWNAHSSKTKVSSFQILKYSLGHKLEELMDEEIIKYHSLMNEQVSKCEGPPPPRRCVIVGSSAAT